MCDIVIGAAAILASGFTVGIAIAWGYTIRRILLDSRRDERGEVK